MTQSSRKKQEREAHLRWVPIDAMRVNDHAQRDLNQSRVDRILANLDLEQIGTPTVNQREGNFYIIDGQHRVQALRDFGLGAELLQCWTYEGLSEEAEAEMFLKLNDTLAVDLMSKFKVGIQAGREEDCDINRIVLSQGLKITREKVDGGIAAIGTVQRVYRRYGGATLGRSLRIIRDSFGDAGLEAPVIDGMGRVTAQFNGSLSDDHLVKNLRTMRGGVSGLLNMAETTRRQMGIQKGDAVAANIVAVYNRDKRGKAKLPDWIKAVVA